MKKIGVSVFALLLCTSVHAQAQQGSIELQSASQVEVVTKRPDGSREKKLVDAGKTKVVPGDVVIFTTRYANKGRKPATNVVIKNPVPEHTTYADRSAEGAGAVIDFSVDKGKSYGPADRLTIKDAQGKVRTASAADYTNIRWTITRPLAPGAEGSVSFKVRIK